MEIFELFTVGIDEEGMVAVFVNEGLGADVLNSLSEEDMDNLGDIAQKVLDYLESKEVN